MSQDIIITNNRIFSDLDKMGTKVTHTKGVKVCELSNWDRFWCKLFGWTVEIKNPKNNQLIILSRKSLERFLHQNKSELSLSHLADTLSYKDIKAALEKIFTKDAGEAPPRAPTPPPTPVATPTEGVIVQPAQPSGPQIPVISAAPDEISKELFNDVKKKLSDEIVSKNMSSAVVQVSLPVRRPEGGIAMTTQEAKATVKATKVKSLVSIDTLNQTVNTDE